MAENKNINNIKFQNQSYAMMIKKDKETIENLKKQILDYQFLIKQKDSENKTKKNIKKSYILNNKKIENLNLEYMSQNNQNKREKINEKKEKRNHSSSSGKFPKKIKKFENNLSQKFDEVNTNNYLGNEFNNMLYINKNENNEITGQKYLLRMLMVL